MLRHALRLLRTDAASDKPWNVSLEWLDSHLCYMCHKKQNKCSENVSEVEEETQVIDVFRLAGPYFWRFW